jgi:hypothetical protein
MTPPKTFSKEQLRQSQPDPFAGHSPAPGQDSIRALIGEQFEAKIDPETGQASVNAELFSGAIFLQKTEYEIVKEKVLT